MILIQKLYPGDMKISASTEDCLVINWEDREIIMQIRSRSKVEKHDSVKPKMKKVHAAFFIY